MRVNTRVALDAAGVAHELRRRAACARRRTGSPASRSATYASTVVDRSAGPAVVGRPRAVVALLRADPARRRRARAAVVEDAEVVAQEEILGVDGHVRLELALPPAVGVLQREQVLERARSSASAGGGDRQRRASVIVMRALPPASAGAPIVRRRDRRAPPPRPRWPLSTALSIVAGQPVSVHAPAR